MKGTKNHNLETGTLGAGASQFSWEISRLCDFPKQNLSEKAHKKRRYTLFLAYRCCGCFCNKGTLKHVAIVTCGFPTPFQNLKKPTLRAAFLQQAKIGSSAWLQMAFFQNLKGVGEFENHRVLQKHLQHLCVNDRCARASRQKLKKKIAQNRGPTNLCSSGIFTHFCG